MISIVETEYSSPYLPKLETWFAEEWGAGDFFRITRNGAPIPPPLIALENDKLCGGLSFTRYKNPKSDYIALWVNAVFVPTEFRGKAIANKLVLAAVKLAAEQNEQQLFARTNVPQLYVKAGWEIIGNDGDDKLVMWTTDSD